MLTAEQMRTVEKSAIDSGRATGVQLMERAGAAVVAAVLAQYPAMATGPKSAVILCGPGNNGGDGFVIARLLHQRGWRVRVFLLGEVPRLPPDARTMHDRWAGLGAVARLDDPLGGVDCSFGADAPDLIVDALFGTGLSRPMPMQVQTALTDIDCWRERQVKWPPMVAVDLPSGLCANSGRPLGQAARCDLTVTFHAAKPGHYLAQGPEHCGQHLVVADIGLPDTHMPGAVQLVTAAHLPAPKHSGHKYDHGHALVLAGGFGRTGAARLAARAALRAGAGLVSVAAPGPAMAECACHLTAIMLRQVDDAEGLRVLLQDQRLNAVCLGPGLGLDTTARAQILAVLAMAEIGTRAVVLDADALGQFADDPGALFAATTRSGRCVLTPHDGEFSRIFPDLATRLAASPDQGPAFSRIDAARAAAARAGCVVLLKGPDTVIAAPDGASAINAAHYERTAPWLATAGSGDVLAGLITGLLARGSTAFQAACAGTWLHVECARQHGQGLIAEDLPEMLPAVLRAL